MLGIILSYFAVMTVISILSVIAADRPQWRVLHLVVAGFSGWVAWWLYFQSGLFS